LLAVHDSLYEFFVSHAEDLDLSQTGPLLDRLGDAITSVKVVGTTEEESVESLSVERGAQKRTGVKVSSQSIGADIGVESSSSLASGQERRLRQTGVQRYSIHFGSVRQVLDQMLALMRPRRVWLLLDEWSTVPVDLQPYLADLLRRSVFPLNSITVKIAAIEQRSRFRVGEDVGDYIGIEVGADAAADVNLDDFMVFENDAERAREFFKELLFKHASASQVFEQRASAPTTSDELIRQGFTQINTFDELVRAAEGVPRDAINILSLAAQDALDEQISVNHTRRAAQKWYQRDKEAGVRANERANELLHWIIDEVIGNRKARAFLLRSNVNHSLIEALFDARILHILKRSISTHDQPGVRYDVYKLDYGCYVDLIATVNAPQGLLPREPENGEDGFIDVPPDDYRSIRRAILDIHDFETQVERTNVR
jgi:hypothetical protein